MRSIRFDRTGEFPGVDFRSGSGVGYRYSTREKAIALGITGWVRNLPSGQVEALIVGDSSAVNSLLTWFESGPPAAEVSAVETKQKDPASLEPALLESFEIRR